MKSFVCLTWLVFLMTVILCVAGCGLSSGLATVTPTNPAGDEQILFKDHFTEITSGWRRASGSSGLSDYDDGVFRILVNEPNSDVWTTPDLDLDDVIIEVSTFKAGGSRDNRFGILCRAVQPDQFYALMISSDGYFGIGKMKGEVFELLGEDSLQSSEFVQKGAAINHLRAACVGSRLSLWVNGEKLIEVEDNEFTSGDTGLFAGTYNEPGTDIRFDDFIISTP